MEAQGWMQDNYYPSNTNESTATANNLSTLTEEVKVEEGKKILWKDTDTKEVHILYFQKTKQN